MIVYKMWTAAKGEGMLLRTWRREGWFLFGVVPLFTRDVTSRP
jgi:hypothetical protein